MLSLSSFNQLNKSGPVRAHGSYPQPLIMNLMEEHCLTLETVISVRNNMHEFYKTFKLEDDIYMKLINMTREDLDKAIDRLNDIHSRFYNLIDTTRNHPSNVVKGSLLPLGNMLGFLFGTASSGDIKGLKKDIQTLHANQVKHGEILNEVSTITNISNDLIHENRLTINDLINSVEFLNETLVNIHEDIEPLFVTRRFLLVQTI